MEQITHYATEFDHGADLAWHAAAAVSRSNAALADWGTYQPGMPDEDLTTRRVGAALSLLEHAQALALHATQLQTYAARLARFEGATWSEIGEALDVTRQAAHERYGTPATPKRGDVTGTLSWDERPML